MTKYLSGVEARFGFSSEEYRQMWRAQEGRCAICGEPERSARQQRLAIDHDHKTGTVRGLLCSHCNRAIGLMGDDVLRLVAAAAYLGATLMETDEGIEVWRKVPLRTRTRSS